MATELHRMIRSQPGVLEQLAEIDVAAAAATLGRASRVVIVGTGTSFHAAELGAYLFRTGGVDAMAVPAIEAARWYPQPPADAAYVIISHTGSTAYALALRTAVQCAGRPLVTITGQAAGWAEAIKTPTQETSETYTVSYTAALAVLGLLAHHAANTPTGPAELLRAASATREAVEQPGTTEITVPRRAMAIMGAGPWAITATEGALKIRESAHLLAEGFDPERLLHGAAVPYDNQDVLIGLQPDADPDGLTGQLLDAARDEGIRTYVLADHHTDLHPYLRQLAAVARLQLLASQLTVTQGTNPDTVIAGAWARDALWATGAPRQQTDQEAGSTLDGTGL
ncbi:MAG: SIS domain-containing protein [Sciscionella sp.]